jgi:hypothetical protein
MWVFFNEISFEKWKMLATVILLCSREVILEFFSSNVYIVNWSVELTVLDRLWMFWVASSFMPLWAFEDFNLNFYYQTKRKGWKSKTYVTIKVNSLRPAVIIIPNLRNDPTQVSSCKFVKLTCKLIDQPNYIQYIILNRFRKKIKLTLLSLF